MKKWYVMAAAFLLATSLLTGCGEKTDPDQSKQTSSRTETVDGGKEDTNDGKKTDTASHDASSAATDNSIKGSVRHSHHMASAYYDPEIETRTYITDYTGSFYSDVPEVQSFIDSYDCTIDDALIATAYYHLNTERNAMLVEAVPVEFDTLDTMYRLDDCQLSGGTQVVFCDINFAAPIFKSTEYSAEGQEYYVVRMVESGNMCTVLCFLTVEADGKIVYVGDDLPVFFLSKGYGYTQWMALNIAKAQPKEFWGITSEFLSNSKNMERNDFNAYVASKVLPMIRSPKLCLMACYSSSEEEQHKSSQGDDYPSLQLDTREQASMEWMASNASCLASLPVVGAYVIYDDAYMIPPYAYWTGSSYMRYADLSENGWEKICADFASKDLKDNPIAMQVYKVKEY